MKKNIATLFITIFCIGVAFGQKGRIEIPQETRKYIKKAADGDHLALEGGHLTLDGHVMPYPFFENHEVLFLYRLSKLRHNMVWRADSLYHQPDWDKKNPTITTAQQPGKKIAASTLSGARFTYDTYWVNIPQLPKSTTGWERFFCLKPMELSLPGWPETTIYVNGKPEAALLRQHFYWDAKQMMDENQANEVCLKSFGISSQPRGYREVSVVERNPVADELYWYTRVLIEAASILPDTAKGAKEIRTLADEIMMDLNLDLGGNQSLNEQMAQVLTKVKQRFAEIEKLAGDSPVLKMLMHGHLDSAWRWTLAHTDEKIQRLVMNNLYLMDRFPEYKYIFTTPYHYERMAELYPDLFGRVEEKIAAGQWIADGSTYVETDMNLPGGESIVRQFLYGLDYFRNTLGVKKNSLFLPDTFGYPRFLPQVAQGFGLDHLIAMRTNTDEIDHTIYNFKGIDGSTILVNGLCTPAWEYPFVDAIHDYKIANPSHISTYNAPDPGPRRLMGTWEQFKNKSQTNEQLILIGWGDGGGGGTEDQIELMKRVNSLPSIPQVEWTNLYDYIQSQLQNKEKFATFDERILPSSFIQRTFTMANGIKKNNRAVEQRLRETEVLSAWAMQYGFDYPQEQLTEFWKTLLLHHFHDIITGMAVPEVLSQANLTLQELERDVTRLRDSALDHLLKNMEMPSEGIVIFNPSGVNMTGVQTLDNVAGRKGQSLVNENGEAIKSEWLGDRFVVDLPSISPMSFRKLYWNEAKPLASTPFASSKRTLENELVKVMFNEQGEITSFWDKEQNRELVPAGKVFNKLLAVEHKGGRVTKPTWEKVVFSNPKNGMLTTSLTIKKKFKTSAIEQEIILKQGSKSLAFNTKLDWKEEDRLEADFPLDFSTDAAHHGIQWGYDQVKRTSYAAGDSLKMPLCAHQWADVSDRDYGVALFDNTRYGYNLKKGGLRLVLTYGQHRHGYEEMTHVPWSPVASGDDTGMDFSYALFPHVGDLSEGDVVQQAAAFNTELIVRNKEQAVIEKAVSEALFEGLPKNVILQTIKKAENGSGMIVRMYETEQRTTRVDLGIKGAKHGTRNEFE